MEHVNWGKTPESEARLQEVRNRYKYVCKHCGWSNVIYPFEKIDKKICKNCGNYVYTNKKSEFKDKLKGLIK